MNLEEKWSATVAGCEEGEAANNYEGPWAVVLGARGTAFAECMADLKAARTPRPPKAEWFGAPVDAEGKPTGKWDAWIIKAADRTSPKMQVWHDAHISAGFLGHDGFAHSWLVEDIEWCIPVRREGPPAMDVGWDVVGG